MAQIAPWLQTPDYIGAMRAGAGIGLERARIDTGSAEAADRLKLAYSQLAAQEDRAAELAAQRQQHAAEALKHQSDMFQFQKQKDAEMQQYRQQEEERKNTALQELVGYRNSRLGQIDTGQSETARHHGVTESISSEKAKAMIDRGAAEPVTFPEFPGMTFIKQPSGTILKVESEMRSPTVSLDATGAFKGASGAINNPQMRALMGTNSLPGAVTAPAAPTAAPPPAFWTRLPFVGGSSATPPASAGDALRQPQGQAAPKRVKVIGPNGQKGTIQEGDDLPDGWKLAE